MSSAVYRDLGPRRGALARPAAAGLPAPAATLVVLGLALLGALLDGLTGRGLRTGFAVLFVSGCVLAAVLVRRSGLRPLLVALPLLYALVVLVSALQQGGAATRSTSQRALQVFTDLSLAAPALVVGTAVALVVALARVARR